MHVLFDEAGKFLAGRILSEAEASAQVELDSGKRVKVKSANQLLRFDKPAPAELMAQAAPLAQPCHSRASVRESGICVTGDSSRPGASSSQYGSEGARK